MTVYQFLQALDWREPLWLLLVLQPLLLIILRRLMRNRNLSAYADQSLHRWVTWQPHVSGHGHGRVRGGLYTASWILLSASLAGPRLAVDQPEIQRTTYRDIMVVIDASRSMRAADVQPDRLQRARTEMHTLLRMAAHSRVGIILYAARPHLLVPLTRDRHALEFYVRQLSDIRLPTRGSKPSSALEQASRQLDAYQDGSSKAIVWLTDGDVSRTEKSVLEHTALKLSERNTPLFILGLGSAEGGAVPVADGWLEVDGRAVISRLDSALLAKLAKLGGGSYAQVRDDDADWHRLYRGGIAEALTDPAANDDAGVTWEELYPWTLLPALLLLFICLAPYRLPTRHSTTMTLACLLMGMVGLQSPPALAGAGQANDLTVAYRHLDKERYAQALEEFTRVPGYAGRLGEGISLYRLGKFTQAARRFNQAVLLAPSGSERGMAIYNLANSYFQQGDYVLAAQLYEDALRYPGDHAAARHNRTLSSELARAIEAEKSARTASRMGSGPQAGRAVEGLDINQSGSITFDSEEDDRQRNLSLPALPEAERDRLIRQGIEHARLRGKYSTRASQDARQAVETSRLALRMRELADNQPALWQRLFEMEEGFPAPLDAPRDVPGYQPW